MRKNDDLIPCLSEEQRQQIRRLTGQDTEEVKLGVMTGPEALVLAGGGFHETLEKTLRGAKNTRAQENSSAQGNLPAWWGYHQTLLRKISRSVR